MKKNAHYFEVTKILDYIVENFDPSKKEIDDDSIPWPLFLKIHFTSPPWRDNLVKYNNFVCDICYIVGSQNLQKEEEKIFKSLIKSTKGIIFNFNLIIKISELADKKIFTMKEYLNVVLLLYLSNIESNLRDFLNILVDSIIKNKSKFCIIKRRNIKKGDKWEYKDTGAPVPITTIMKPKEIHEIKEINEKKQLGELQVREITNGFRENYFDNITKTINKLCNFELRNYIAHGKYNIDSNEQKVIFSNQKIMSFNRIMEEYYKLDDLLKLLWIGIDLSLYVFAQDINISKFQENYRKSGHKRPK